MFTALLFPREEAHYRRFTAAKVGDIDGVLVPENAEVREDFEQLIRVPHHAAANAALLRRVVVEGLENDQPGVRACKIVSTSSRALT